MFNEKKYKVSSQKFRQIIKTLIDPAIVLIFLVVSIAFNEFFVIDNDLNDNICVCAAAAEIFLHKNVAMRPVMRKMHYASIYTRDCWLWMRKAIPGAFWMPRQVI